MYELVIIGAGPAGLTASIYANRARINTLILERLFCGGQLMLTEKIENFPGFEEGVLSAELVDRMRKQAERFGAKIEYAEVSKIEKISKTGAAIFEISTADGKTIQAKAVIIATGARAKKLNVPGEDKFTGKGVSYCATCDGPLYKNKDVTVIGAGDSAIEEALFLARFAKSVTIIHRRNQLRAAKILQELAKKEVKIKFVLESVVSEICGDSKVGYLNIKSLKTEKTEKLNCDGVFIFAGYSPNTESFKNIVDLSEDAYIITDNEMMTSCPGIFACGDCRKKNLYQVINACGDGAVAAFSAQRYLSA